MITKKCLQCGKEFQVSNSRKDTAKFCSFACRDKSYKGKPTWNKGKKCVMPTPWNKGIPMTNEIKLKLSLSKKGQKAWNKGTKGLCKPNKTSFKKGNTPPFKGKKFLAITGSKNPNWKGGITKENEKQRKSLEYKLWRKAVYERDNYTCVLCGCNESGKLNADHIKPFSLFPELRFAIDNGRTLCIDCHKKTDSYMTNIRKLEKLYLDK